MDHFKVCRGCFEAILILDPVDVEEEYSHNASLITVHDNIFDDMDEVMLSLTKEMTQWSEDLFLAMKLPRQK